MTDIGNRTQNALEQYKDGLILEGELRSLLREIVLGTFVPLPKSPPQEKTKLKHQAKYLRRQIAKAQRLLKQRETVHNLRQELAKVEDLVRHDPFTER